MIKTVLITGANSGIGLATAQMCLQNNYRIIACVRELKKGQALEEFAQTINATGNLFFVEMDISSGQSVFKAFRAIEKKKLSIDVLINNAGFGLFGELENLSVEDLKNQFETNLFGTHRLIQQILPQMRTRNSGIIINMSSISGKVTFPYFGAYASSKFALEGYTQTLWGELFKTNIRVYLVEPGPVETDFYRNVHVSKNRSQKKIDREEYSFLARLQKRVKVGSRSNPNIIAETVIRLIEGDSKKLRHPAGFLAGILLFLQKLLPDQLFLRLIQALY